MLDLDIVEGEPDDPEAELAANFDEAWQTAVDQPIGALPLAVVSHQDFQPIVQPTVDLPEPVAPVADIPVKVDAAATRPTSSPKRSGASPDWCRDRLSPRLLTLDARRGFEVPPPKGTAEGLS